MTTANRPQRAVVFWAAVGAVWLAVVVRAAIGWVTSSDFGPAPVPGPDALATGKLVGLRVMEVVSVVVLVVFGWFMVVKPWRAAGHVPFNALLFVGALGAFFMDSWLNLYDYLFAFNARSVNLGTWVRFLPFYKDSSPHQYGEALLWGAPMYIYFCAGLGVVGASCVRRLLRAAPRRSFAAALAIVWCGELLFDFVAENILMRTTDAYAFVRTKGGLTLWAGSVHQFPIYESVLVACMATLFTWVQLSADGSPDGMTAVERGTSDLPARLRTPARLLAAIGFCAAALMAYHLPYNWISIGGDSIARLPSYLQPGDPAGLVDTVSR